MKTPNIRGLRACALATAFASTGLMAAGAKPLEVAFVKCFAHKGEAPYLVTFAGTATGAATGPLEARIVAQVRGVEANQTHLQADYVVEGSLPFTARVGGRVDDLTKLAVLRGYVSVGPPWLLGAGVLDEFENYMRADGVACSKGTLYITPRWKQQDDGN